MVRKRSQEREREKEKRTDGHRDRGGDEVVPLL